MGNRMRIDMGNSFDFISRPFRGRDVEHPYSGGATAAVCEVGVEGPTKHVAVVSVVWNQPQVRLQMETSLRARRSARTLGSEAASATLATANEREVDEANSAIATAPSQLGKSQVASSTGQRIQRAACPGSTNDQQMAQKDEAQRPGTAAYSPWTAQEPWKVDGGGSEQPGMDGRLQRMVSNARRASSRSVDGAGFAQSISAEYPAVARSAVGAGAAHLSWVVSTLRLSGGHSGGQRQSVRIDWPSGAFALERLVDGAGNLRGVYCPRASRTKRRARANASSDEGRNHSAALAQPASAATPDGSMGLRLQHDSAARRTGAAAPGGSVSSPSTAPQKRTLEVSPVVGDPPSQKQRGNQMAGTKAFRGRSICGISSGPQTKQGEMGNLFRSTAGWRTLVWRSEWNAPGQVFPSQRLTPRTCRECHAPPRRRMSPHALRAVPLRGEGCRTNRSAPPPAGRSGAGG